MRTGTRWTIFVKLPVAFSGGSRENCEPEPGAKLSTWPFSAGPAECPGRNVVLLTTSTLLANLLGTLNLRLQSTPGPSPDEPLPMTLNQLTLRFGVEPARSPITFGTQAVTHS